MCYFPCLAKQLSYSFYFTQHLSLRFDSELCIEAEFSASGVCPLSVLHRPLPAVWSSWLSFEGGRLFQVQPGWLMLEPFPYQGSAELGDLGCQVSEKLVK